VSEPDVLGDPFADTLMNDEDITTQQEDDDAGSRVGEAVDFDLDDKDGDE
jgi:hypothetical protein